MCEHSCRFFAVKICFFFLFETDSRRVGAHCAFIYRYGVVSIQRILKCMQIDEGNPENITLTEFEKQVRVSARVYAVWFDFADSFKH